MAAPVIYAGAPQRKTKSMPKSVIEKTTKLRCSTCLCRCRVVTETYERSKELAEQNNRPFMVVCQDCFGRLPKGAALIASIHDPEIKREVERHYAERN